MQTAAPRIQNKTHYSPSALHCTGTRTHGQITHWLQFIFGVAFCLAYLGLVSTSGVMWKRISWV